MRRLLSALFLIAWASFAHAQIIGDGITGDVKVGGGGGGPVVAAATMYYRADTGTGGSGTTTPTGTGNAVTNQNVGQATASGSPTSWSITGCTYNGGASSCSGWFSICNTSPTCTVGGTPGYPFGSVYINSTGQPNLTNTGSYAVTVQATNGSGSGSAVQTVVNRPNASSTGYRLSNCGGALTPSATLTISAGGTYSCLSFTNTSGSSLMNITTTAQVNFVDCLFTDSSTSSVGSFVLSGNRNVNVSYSTMIGAGTASMQIPQYGFWTQTGFTGSLVVDHVDQSKYGQNVSYGNSSATLTYTYDYFHAVGSGSGTHYENNYNGGSGGPIGQITIENNTWLNQNVQTAVSYNETEFGPLDNFLLSNNLLVGGDFTVYVYGPAGNFPVGATNNFIITGNQMGFTTGEFGYFDIQKGSQTVFNVTHNNNVDWISGVNVD